MYHELVASGFSIPKFSGRGRRETLADYLAAGPPSLSVALHCATSIADSLRDLHEDGRAYGGLSPSAVIIADSGTSLMPHHIQSPAPLSADIQAFGSILNELMIRSVAAPGEYAGPAGTTSRSTPLGIRTAAARLAGRCMAAKGDSPGIQQVLTEVRLLYVMARQNESDPQPAAPPVPVIPTAPYPIVPAAPFLPNPQPKASAVPRPLPDVPEVAPVVPLQATSFGKPEPRPMPETERAGGKCPKCDSSDVFVSRPRSKLENLLVRWKFPLCRCHRCYHRWFKIMGIRFAKDMPVGSRGRSFKKARRVHRRS